MGQVVGESASKADVPDTQPIRPQDLMATVFHVLGIDPHTQFQTRPAARSICSRRASRLRNWFKPVNTNPTRQRERASIRFSCLRVGLV